MITKDAQCKCSEIRPSGNSRDKGNEKKSFLAYVVRSFSFPRAHSV